LVAANTPHESGNQSATVILEEVSVLPVGLTEGPDMSRHVWWWMSGIDKLRYVPGMSSIDVWMFGIDVWYRCVDVWYRCMV